ncbi:MAG: sodium:solute symporter family protein [Halobacteriovoraceae bacterium]|nr:sodium:solute symporter family protein [Halobacteriovoraceae bacterium]
MTPEIFKYIIVAIFIFVTYYLSYLGMKKTKCLKSFSIGQGDINPYIVGITMSSSIASTATFVINPGFVYNHGLSAYLHYGVAALLGIVVAFVVLTKRFKHLGQKNGAITIPEWIYKRYNNRRFSLYFAFINLLSITFVVLILVGCSLLISSLFPIDQKMSLFIALIFVFSYVLMGGTYAHAYTNTLQGGMMILISLFLFFQGLHLFKGDFFNTLQGISPDYASIYNPSSTLYYDFFSVFLSSFLITFALMMQPHILTKVLYIKEDKDLRKFLGTTFVVSFIFGLVLFIGFYARLSGLEVDRQDAVVVEYINHIFSNSSFGPYILSFVNISLLAAGLSTLDGILVGLSSMVVNDIYIPLKGKTDNALNVSRLVLIGIGIISFALAWNPPQLVGLFAQKGVYALACAFFFPILLGIFDLKIDKRVIIFSSIFAPALHLIFNLSGHAVNPSVSAAMGILYTGAIVVSSYIKQKKKESLLVRA